MTPWMFGMNNYSTSLWLPVPQGIPFYEKTILINWKLDSDKIVTICDFENEKVFIYAILMHLLFRL